MKYGQLLTGLLIGALIGFGLTLYFFEGAQLIVISPAKSVNSTATNQKWSWPDSLDAINAAPANHQVVYEDSSVRVLAVLLNGKQSEPIHTHKWKSIMWIAKPIVPCQINNYLKNEYGKLVKKDSLLIKEMPVNAGQLLDPEGPTSIKNLGSDSGVAYRVEFKKGFVN
ncbi:hypothetical protein [Pedobacter frigidisoli]|uniref:hypothetical protein n=1 Tax=Pedobacter frigidisoli TaxID=2530455 RepID=UPI00292E0B5C|nr:hypothetical protein [Pedobacter frigidisoli]